MLPSCTSCVPSCSLFPRSAGGKVMLPPLTSGSSHDSAMTNNHALEGLAQEPPMHPTCSCHPSREGFIRPSSSSGRPSLRNESAGNYFNDHDHIFHQQRPMVTRSDIDITGATSSRQPLIMPPPTSMPSSHDRKIISRPTTAAATVSPPIDVTTSQQAATKTDLTSSVRTFRFKNSSMTGQNANRRDTKSSSGSSPSDTDGSLKEINITRRARRQIYLKPDVEGSPFRLLMYVDCRSVEPSQEMDVT